jgi:hypothetical protein
MVDSLWESCVIEGVALLGSHPRGHLDFSEDEHWRFGAMLLTTVPRRSGRANATEDQNTLIKLAADLGCNFNVVKDHWYTESAWPPGTRLVGVSYSQHAKFRARKQLLLDILSDDESDLNQRDAEMVGAAEKLLRNANVREAVISRARSRTSRVAQAAKAIEDEQLALERAEARAEARRLEYERLKTDLAHQLPLQAIAANKVLARVAGDLYDLDPLMGQLPVTYTDRTVANLERVERAVTKLLAYLRPQPEEPMPYDTVIDVSSGDGNRAIRALAPGPVIDLPGPES